MVSNTLGALIARRLREKDLSQKGLADHAGVKPQAVTKWLKGGRIEDERLKLVADYLGLKAQDLIAARIGYHKVEEPKEIHNSKSGIPVVGTTQGGPNREWLEMGYPPGFGDEYIAMVSRDSHAYALHVRGSSMAPRIREGDVIVVEPTMAAEAGDEVVVRTTDGQVMVKTLVSNRNDQVILESIAQDHGRIVLRFSEVEFIHAVGAIVPPKSILKRNVV